jgi:aryl-alcohol dehydrogenase-like predicted oxidoreductase
MAPTAPILKTIPSTGERLPVIGLGTNAFTESLAAGLIETLRQFAAAGARVIDTAAAYGESEQVLGRLVAELALRDRLFLATKFTTPIVTGTGAGPGGRQSFERSLQRLCTGHVDLLYVHNMIGIDQLLPMMLEWRQAGQLRYLGVSTSHNQHHAAIVECLCKYPLDFVQINYGLAGREAELTVLKTAMERGVAVVANVPLGGRSGRELKTLLARPLPAWAGEIGCSSWPQLMLKYVISHPAVTCVISGSTRTEHLTDNQQAGRGVLPDAAMRLRIEQCWDATGLGH